jgi:hypothetical protein
MEREDAEPPVGQVEDVVIDDAERKAVDDQG